MKNVIIVLALLLSLPALASDYNTEIAKFFDLYEKGEKIEAIDKLYSTNKWMGSAADAIHNIKTQLASIEQVVGSYNGKVMIGEVNVKDRFVHATYLALYDRQPVRMEFQFYRPNNDWILYSFAFDIAFDNEIEQGARAKVAAGE